MVGGFLSLFSMPTKKRRVQVMLPVLRFWKYLSKSNTQMVTSLYYDDRPWDSFRNFPQTDKTAKTREFVSPSRCQLNFPDSWWDFGLHLNSWWNIGLTINPLSTQTILNARWTPFCHPSLGWRSCKFTCKGNNYFWNRKFLHKNFIFFFQKEKIGFKLFMYWYIIIKVK